MAVIAGSRPGPPPIANALTGAVAGAARVLQRNLMVYRRTWRGSLFGSFLTPLLYLTAMGIGLSQLMARGGTDMLGGVRYLDFLGPGILASSCMQTASFESTYPIMGKISWRRNYEAILATPMEVHHLLIGELSWIAFRMTSMATVFLIVLTVFGIPRSPLALLAIPAAVLTGVAFAAPIIAFAATRHNDSGFAALFRFVINPLFLFSGTFFPVSQLPDAGEWVAAATPLYHGVALVRGAVLDSMPATWPLHLAYLVVFVGATGYVAYRLLRRRLVK
ncbi:MAG TPA: ABC transporter permease [Candidatus Limnocylindria bacterium]|jgi:lipooligosaccharide transport system permease protein|nr:ABC transporter permease [Candidatus Limnocylindria bacterium]